ncbi:MAG: hypothetical protein AAGC47_10200, partial [Bacteroidota bacterium]
GRIMLRDLLVQLNSEGKTILISSHLLSEIEQMATHIGILKDGRLIYDGTLNDLQNRRGDEKLITVEVSDAELVKSLLEGRQDQIAVKRVDGIYVDIAVPHREEIPKLTKLFIENGIKVYSLVSKQDNLEDMFLKSLL